MKKPLLKNLLFCLLIFCSQHAFAQPANDACSGAVTLTVSPDCTTTNGTFQNAASGITPTMTCGSGTKYDVWYRFTATESFVTISVNLTTVPTQMSTGNTYIELFNTNTCTPTTANTLGCQNIGSGRTWGVTAGTTYLMRIMTCNVNATSTNAGQWNFSICITSNNNCSTATTIVTGGANQLGNTFGATQSTPATCGGTADDDVWYKFVATFPYANINLSNISSGLASSGTRMQLYGGSCASLNSLYCTSGSQINATGLTVGNTYWIRVYSAGNTAIGSNGVGTSFVISIGPGAAAQVGSGRLKEVYSQTIISPPQVLLDPWEVTLGYDGYLWVTESRGYKIFRINPTTGFRDTILDISQGAAWFADATLNTNFNVQFSSTQNPWPQGGFAGMAFHPQFTSGRPYIYVDYTFSFQSNNDPNGVFFTNRIARFKYNSATNKCDSAIWMADIPGSSDHNSQRLIIAPVSGTNYLFAAAGDMGAGQFANRWRTEKAQDTTSYEGKILRFNLTEDGDAVAAQKWIPNNNPYPNLPIWCIGLRNNQGFAYDAAKDILYGTSHGPYSDDELNILKRYTNYGHPIIIGKAADNNYLNSSAGYPNAGSSCPTITDEQHAADSINASVYAHYQDPLFSAYDQDAATVHNIWVTNPNNGGWPSEGWSGLDLYTSSYMPGWKGSLVAGSLKWGRLVRFKLGPTGTTILPTVGKDTISYFGSQNRFRDLAISADGKDIYVVMDRSTSTSGPSAAFPVIPACQGCLVKYSFLGYNDNGGKSTLDSLAVPITTGSTGTCNAGTPVTIDSTNWNLWVPITGADGNVMAEINSNGQKLGLITSSFWLSSSIRVKAGVHYLNRNMTITPQFQPSTPVKIRLYIAKTEYNALDADPLSSISQLSDLKILKNTDACGGSVAHTTTLIATTAESWGTDKYVLAGTIPSFSSFYFAAANITLPTQLITFTGTLQPNNSVLLKWKSENEVNVARYEIERSIDGSSFGPIGNVTARGTGTTTTDYNYIDNNAANQSSDVLFYRLRIVDKDGAVKYSNIITINLKFFVSVSVSPNPVKDEMKVSIVAPADGNVQWKLIDNAGRTVLMNSVQVRKGAMNNMSIDMSKMMSGAYYLQVKGAGLDEKINIQKL